MSAKRIIECDKEWYANLLRYLQPEERFISDDGEDSHGLILYVPPIRRILVFVPKKEKEEA